MEESFYTTAFAYFRAANDYDSSSNTTQHNNATTTLKVIRYKLLRFHLVNYQDVPVTPDEYDDFVINAYDYDIIRQLFFGQLPEEDVEEEFRKSMLYFILGIVEPLNFQECAWTMRSIGLMQFNLTILETLIQSLNS